MDSRQAMADRILYLAMMIRTGDAGEIRAGVIEEMGKLQEQLNERGLRQDKKAASSACSDCEVCPHCGYINWDGDDNRDDPSLPGDVNVCRRCGGLYRIGSMTIRYTMDGISPEEL